MFYRSGVVGQFPVIRLHVHVAERCRFSRANHTNILHKGTNGIPGGSRNEQSEIAEGEETSESQA
jgi:hypothetical protein